jgi:hypothetical protein
VADEIRRLFEADHGTEEIAAAARVRYVEGPTVATRRRR